MTECVNEDDVELSLELAIGSGGRLRKCSGLDVVVKNDGVLERQETRKKQEVRRGGAVRVDEDERVRKKAKSGFRFESVDEGGGSLSSSDCISFSGQLKRPSDHIARVAADEVKQQLVCSRGNDDKLSSSAPARQCLSSPTLMGSKERSVVSHFAPLAKMPCVSTTGTGPGGTTVKGFLYRYTKEEVCIVCVCHGFLFSPAKFVEHAGGINVENPLRHITVTPLPSTSP